METIQKCVPNCFGSIRNLIYLSSIWTFFSSSFFYILTISFALSMFSWSETCPKSWSEYWFLLQTICNGSGLWCKKFHDITMNIPLIRIDSKSGDVCSWKALTHHVNCVWVLHRFSCNCVLHERSKLGSNLRKCKAKIMCWHSHHLLTEHFMCSIVFLSISDLFDELSIHLILLKTTCPVIAESLQYGPPSPNISYRVHSTSSGKSKFLK